MLFNKMGLALGITSSVLLTGCFQEEKVPEPTTVIPTVSVNSAPTAAPSQVGNALIANAHDLDNDYLAYSWKVGSVVIGLESSIDMDLVPVSVMGVQDVTLEISDTKTTSTFTITEVDFGIPVVINSAPTASPSGTANALYANAMDVDGDVLSYNWMVGSTNIGTTSSIFINSAPTSIMGLHTVVLTISDSINEPVYKIVENVDFGITNTGPTAAPIQVGRALIANATDIDGDALTYKWIVQGVVIGLNSSYDLDLAPESIMGFKDVTLEVSDSEIVHLVTMPDIDFGTPIVVNLPPTASPVVSGNFIFADANDVDGDTLTYSWKVGSTDLGSDILININNAPESITGLHTVILTINDSNNDPVYTIIENVDFGYTNSAPTAAPEQIGSALIANANDVDNDVLTYNWRVNAIVIGVSSSIDINEAPIILTGEQHVVLEISDSNITSTYILSDVDFGSPIIPNTAPTAIPYISGNVLIANATDVDGDDLSYIWKVDGLIIGQSSTLDLDDAPQTIVGVNDIFLEVNDAELITVTVISNVDFGSNTVNNAPTANPVQNAQLLMANATDLDGDALSYVWLVGSTIIGTDSSVSVDTAPDNFVGLQTVTLIVSDSSTSISIEVPNVDFDIAVNIAPIVNPTQSDRVLIANATDADSDTLSYVWRFGAVILGTDSTFDLDDAPSSIVGIQTVVLEVSDGVMTISQSLAAIDFGTPIVVDPENPAIEVITNYDGAIALDQQVTGNTSATLQTAENPFDDAYFYLNPNTAEVMDYSIDLTSDADMFNKMKYIQRQPSAIWMDSIAAITNEDGEDRGSLRDHLDNALQQQAYYEQADGGDSPMTVVVVIYNMPDRNCAAFASNGQLIQVGLDGNTYDSDVLGMGYADYRDEYLAPIKAAFSDPKYASLRIVAMLEPDGFPNMIIHTNEEGTANQNDTLNPDPASFSSGGYCDKILSFNNSTVVPPVSGEGTAGNPTLGVYGDTLRLAISEFHNASLVNNNIYTYMDISNATVLGRDADDDRTDEYAGYDGNNNGTADTLESSMKRAVKYYKQLVDGADGALDGDGLDWVRGFATNISGYTPIEEPLITNSKLFEDVYALESFYQFNASVDELTYTSRLNEYFTTSDPEGYFGTQVFTDIGFIMDTSRNGWGVLGDARPVPGEGTPGTDASKRVDIRPHRGHWCNLNYAGIGEVPKASPSSTHSYLDAFFWMTLPGKSDGISFYPNDFPADGPAYNALDAIDQDVVDLSRNYVYYGRSLDTMCVPGESREDTTVNVVPELAPKAGVWFHKQFVMLIENAYPALGESDYD